MSAMIEAIYEAGVFKPLTPLFGLKERERVRLTFEPVRPKEDVLNLIEQQRQRRILLEPQVASEIGDNHEYDLLGS